MPWCSRCDASYEITNPCPCRKTPTVRPGSGSRDAFSFGDLAATTSMKLMRLERLRSEGFEVDSALVVYATHFARIFDEWHRTKPPGGDAQATEIRRYLEWLPKVDAFLKEHR